MSIKTFTLGLCILLLMSCGKTDESWTENRDELIGTWTGKVNFTQTNLSTNEVTQGIRNTKVRFLNDRDALITELLFTTFENVVEYKWFYQPDPESIIFVRQNSNFGSNIPEAFAIVKRDKNMQTWTGSFNTFHFDQQTMLSSEISVNETWEMTKQ